MASERNSPRKQKSSKDRRRRNENVDEYETEDDYTYQEEGGRRTYDKAKSGGGGGGGICGVEMILQDVEDMCNIFAPIPVDEEMIDENASTLITTDESELDSFLKRKTSRKQRMLNDKKMTNKRSATNKNRNNKINGLLPMAVCGVRNPIPREISFDTNSQYKSRKQSQPQDVENSNPKSSHEPIPPPPPEEPPLSPSPLLSSADNDVIKPFSIPSISYESSLLLDTVQEDAEEDSSTPSSKWKKNAVETSVSNAGTGTTSTTTKDEDRTWDAANYPFSNKQHEKGLLADFSNAKTNIPTNATPITPKRNYSSHSTKETDATTATITPVRNHSSGNSTKLTEPSFQTPVNQISSHTAPVTPLQPPETPTTPFDEKNDRAKQFEALSRNFSSSSAIPFDEKESNTPKVEIMDQEEATESAPNESPIKPSLSYTTPTRSVDQRSQAMVNSVTDEESKYSHDTNNLPGKESFTQLLFDSNNENIIGKSISHMTPDRAIKSRGEQESPDKNRDEAISEDPLLMKENDIKSNMRGKETTEFDDEKEDLLSSQESRREQKAIPMPPFQKKLEKNDKKNQYRGHEVELQSKDDLSLQSKYHDEDDEEDNIASMERAPRKRKLVSSSARPVNVGRKSLLKSLNKRICCNIRLIWIIFGAMLIFMLVTILSVTLSGPSKDPIINSTQENEENADNVEKVDEETVNASPLPFDIFKGISTSPSSFPSEALSHSPSFNPSFKPSIEFTSVPSSPPSTKGEALLDSQPLIVDMIASISGSSIFDTSSFQHKSLIWLIQDQSKISESQSGRALQLDDFRIIQRYILMLLFFSLEGENWANNVGYGANVTECDWFGITCLDSQIIEITLAGNNLRGSLVSEIGELSGLESLSLKSNRLIEGIPESSWGKLVNLKYLSLRSNNLGGSIPTTLGLLKSLEELYLYDNSLEGDFPTEITSLTSLVTLSLEMNKLSGTLPNELGNMLNVEMIRLQNNQFVGSIPSSVTSLENLRFLYLDDNNLEGSIPTNLRLLSNLEELYLSDNALTGSLPSRIGILGQLEILELGHNKLVGSIPTGLCRLSNLQSIKLDENELTGIIPSCIGDLNALRILNLQANSLTSTITSSIGNTRSLERLILRDNQFFGRIPTTLGNLANLEVLDLALNSLTGRIPTRIGSLTQLRFLHLNNNLLRGSLPSSFSRLQNLESLFLFANRLEGRVSDGICNLSIEVFITDCTEIICDCCSECV